MFRFAQRDRRKDAAVPGWSAWNRSRSALAMRALLVIFIAVATVFSVLAFVRYLRGGTTFDYKLWYHTGQHALAGDEIYFFRAGKYDFTYPPPCALFLAGASLLGQGGLIFLLAAINSGAWFFSAKLSALLARSSQRATNPWLHLIPSLLVLVYIWSTYHLGQPNLVLLALMLAAFVALRTKREIAAGSLMAIAAAIKAFPVLGIIYLVYRRYWTAAISLAATLFFLLLILPAPFRGLERAWRDLEKWSAGMLKYSEVTVGQRPMRSYTWKNQSLIGVSNRLLRHVDADAASAPHTPVHVNFADLSFSVVNAIIVTVAVALGMVFVAVMPSRDMRTPQSDAMEFALLLLLMLMVTPLSFGYFYSWLMLPFAVITERVLSGKSRALLWWSLPALGLLAFSVVWPRGAQLYGNTFFACLLLFIGLSIELLHCKLQPVRARSAAEWAC
jgi:hypothetical protein